MKKTRISHILNKLMADKGLHATELARLVNIPQPTIHRVLMGVCEHPHLSTLRPIADYFSVTVDQLKGLEPISLIDHISRVSLITWQDVLSWPSKSETNISHKVLMTDAKIGKNAYALQVKDTSMEPVFPKGAVLIVDPSRQPKDRSYVIAKLHEYSEPIFRQLLIDANNYYLKPLSPDLSQYKMTRLGINDEILGTVAQAKRDYEE